MKMEGENLRMVYDNSCQSWTVLITDHLLTEPVTKLQLVKELISKCSSYL